MKTLHCLGLALAVAFFSLAAAANSAQAADPAAGGKVYELRTYIANPGKLDALHARFRDHTVQLFKKHGMEVVGFWTPAEDSQAKGTLIYILAFPSVEAQKKAWLEFRADPEWVKAKADSEKGGALVEKVESKNLKPTDYSPLR